MGRPDSATARCITDAGVLDRSRGVRRQDGPGILSRYVPKHPKPCGLKLAPDWHQPANAKSLLPIKTLELRVVSIACCRVNRTLWPVPVADDHGYRRGILGLQFCGLDIRRLHRCLLPTEPSLLPPCAVGRGQSTDRLEAPVRQYFLRDPPTFPFRADAAGHEVVFQNSLCKRVRWRARLGRPTLTVLLRPWPQLRALFGVARIASWKTQINVSCAGADSWSPEGARSRR